MQAMIDTETLNVGISAPIFEIGICVFNPRTEEIVDTKQLNVDLLDVIITTGFCPNPETIKWWQDQTYDPRSLPRLSLVDSLLGLSEVFMKWNISKVWANSPSFDCILLQRHYEACKLTVPWKYNQELDFRTLRYLWKGDKIIKGHVSHNALEDAVSQTKLLFQMMKLL